jgi:hypothetical protein
MRTYFAAAALVGTILAGGFVSGAGAATRVVPVEQRGLYCGPWWCAWSANYFYYHPEEYYRPISRPWGWRGWW